MEVKEVSPSSKFFRIWMTLPAPPGGRIAGCRSFHLPQGERTRLSGLAPVSRDRQPEGWLKEIAPKMLTEFDQTTIANMTAALDFVRKKIPADKDSNELRKRIGDELVRCARMGRRSLIDLHKPG